MKNKIELLAPAGTYEAFLAAVQNGADAVYMGGKLFNARANASNFDIDELKKIVKYAHLRNVKIHITMNTLLDDNEINDALNFAYELYEIGVDALIVQDIGLAKILHEKIPNMALHASTQLSTHNLEGVQKLTELGFSRIVLARELSLEEIKYICENTTTEIEIFAHGAMCVSYSGECLMSSMIGDRSGNRGKCAQPCRLPYTLIKNSAEVARGYLLSPKDLSSIDVLKDLPNVTSLKIEGRMKSPEYVATVVRIYKKYLGEREKENYNVSSQDKNDLLQIFNRGGFSSGYLNGKIGKSMMCYEKPKNWGIYVGKVSKYEGRKYITIDKSQSDTEINIGDGIEIWNNTNNSPSTIVSEINGKKIGRIHGDINPGDKVYKTSDKKLNIQAKESYSRGNTRQTPVKLDVTILKDKKITVKITSCELNVDKEFTYESDIIAEESENQPLTSEKVIYQFSKSGDTPFEIKDIKITLDENLFLPVSIVNVIRRNALEQYEQFVWSNLQSNIKPVRKEELSQVKPYSSSVNDSKAISVFFNTTNIKKEFLNFKNIDNFYFKFKTALINLELIKKFNGKKIIVFPFVTKANYANLIKKKLLEICDSVDGFVLSNIGQLEYFEELAKNASMSLQSFLEDKKIELIANYTFNTYNSYAINELETLGFSKVILSPELTKNQINALGGNLQRELITYGNMCVMTSEYCPVGSICGGFSSNGICSKPCIKNDTYYLRDRLGIDFRIIPDNIDCQSQIYNSKITSIESTGLNIDSIRIDIIDENIGDIQKIINTHKAGKKLSGDEYTNGHINRPV